MPDRPRKTDVALAAALAGFCVGEAVLLPLEGSRPLAILLALLMGGVFALRRMAPLAVGLAVTAIVAAYESGLVRVGADAAA
jgi:hypothetical protein